MSDYTERIAKVVEEVKKAVTGKDECIRKAMMAILAGGHILMDDIPGVGKTTMALAFSQGNGFETEACAVYAGCTAQ